MTATITGTMSEGHISEQEADFLAQMRQTNAGRCLAEHVSNATNLMRYPERQTCSMQQVADYTRLFFLLVASSLASKSKMPFSLPTPLPKYIGIYDLSGRRAIVYSNNPSLIRIMSFTSYVIDSVPHQEQREKLIQYAESQPSNHVLVILSMPWQSGVTSTSWEARTFSIYQNPAKETQSVEDGQICFSDVSCSAKRCPPSVTDEGLLFGKETVFVPTGTSKGHKVPCLGEAQAAEFERHVSSTNIDVDRLPRGQFSVSESDSDVVAKLKSLCSQLQRDLAAQRNVVEETSTELEKAKSESSKFKEELWENRKAAQEAITQAAIAQKNSLAWQLDKHKQMLCHRSEELVLKTEELEKVKAAKAKLDKQLSELRKLGEVQTSTFNTTTNTLTQKNSKLEGKVSSLSSELEKAKEELALEKESNLSLQEKLYEKMQIIDSLNLHMEEAERKHTSFASLSSENDSLSREVTVLHRENASMKKSASEMDAVITKRVTEASTITEQLRKTRESIHDLQKENASLKKASKKAVSQKPGTDVSTCTEVAFAPNPYKEICHLRERIEELEAASKSEDEAKDPDVALATAALAATSVPDVSPQRERLTPSPTVSDAVDSAAGNENQYAFVSPDPSLASAARRASFSIQGLLEWLQFEGLLNEPVSAPAAPSRSGFHPHPYQAHGGHAMPHCVPPLGLGRVAHPFPSAHALNPHVDHTPAVRILYPFQNQGAYAPHPNVPGPGAEPHFVTPQNHHPPRPRISANGVRGARSVQ